MRGPSVWVPPFVQREGVTREVKRIDGQRAARQVQRVRRANGQRASDASDPGPPSSIGEVRDGPSWSWAGRMGSKRATEAVRDSRSSSRSYR